MKRKWIKYTVRAIIVCIIVWIIMLTIAFFYIRSNKEKMIALIKSGISQKISGTISFDDLSADFFQNFPGISVELKNVHVHDSLFNLHRRELLNVRHVYIGLGILDILTGNKSPKHITLSDGKIFLFADSSGNKNWKILKSQPGAKKTFDLKTVAFENIETIFQDAGKFKFFDVLFEELKCKIRDGSDQVSFEMSNDAFIKNVEFNTKMGSYLTNKKLTSDWSIVYDKGLKKISMQRQRVRINNQSYKVTGDFFLGNDPHFNLAVETNDLSLEEAASIFPSKTKKRIEQFKLSKPLPKLQVFLSGPMKYQSFPLAKIYFSVNDATLDVSTTQFQHCSFNGFFINEVDSSKPLDDYNSLIQFTQVKGEWEKNSFDGKSISFYNLIQPYVKCEVHVIFQLAQLEKAIVSNRLDFNSGDGEAFLNYSGPLLKNDTVYDLSGKVTVHDGDITYNPRNLNFKSTDIDLSFENGDMLVKKMNTEINGNKININGNVKGFLGFFNTDSSKANFEWNISSPHLDINKLSSSLHRSVVAKKKQGNSVFERLSNKIDRLFDDCNAYLDIRAGKLIYKDFSAVNVKGKLTLRNDMIALDNFSLQHAGGSIIVNASSKDNGSKSDLILQSRMENVNIKELFAAFNNFGMETLTSKNIDGRFSADINFTSMLDANNDLYRPANKGYIDFSLQNGKLENFKPLMEIDNNFLQKRGVSNIDFAELKDRFDINGNDITVNRMEIKSTAVNMYVDGIYSFGSNTDLSIQIPLLKQKKDTTMVPEKKGNNSKGGISVFLRAKDDKDGKLKIGYDLLGRFRNKKKNDDQKIN